MWDEISLGLLVRDILLSLVLIGGISVSVYSAIKRKTAPGVLAAFGFTLMGLEPVADTVIWQFLASDEDITYESLEIAYFLTGGVGLTVGLVLVVIAFLMNSGPWATTAGAPDASPYTPPSSPYRSPLS